MESAVNRSRVVVNHNSWAKCLWDLLILLAVLYLGVVIPYNISFMLFQDIHTWKFDFVFELLFVVDIILNFFTTYQTQSGKVEDDEQAIRKRYLKTCFFVDLLAVTSTYIISLVSALNLLSIPAGNLLKTIRLLHLTLLFRKRFLLRSTTAVALFLTWFIIFVHWTACIWFTIGHLDLLSNENRKAGWLHHLANHLHKPFVNGTAGGPTPYSTYISAVYFTVTALTTVGFGNVSANTDAEKLLAVFIMITGSLVFNLISNTGTTIIQKKFFSPATNRVSVKDQKSPHGLTNEDSPGCLQTLFLGECLIRKEEPVEGNFHVGPGTLIVLNDGTVSAIARDGTLL